MKKCFKLLLILPLLFSSCNKSILPDDRKYEAKKMQAITGEWFYYSTMVAASINENFKGYIVKEKGKYYFINDKNEFHISIYPNTNILNGSLNNSTSNYEGILLEDCYIRVGNDIENKYFNGDERYLDFNLESTYTDLARAVVDHALDIFYNLSFEDVQKYTAEHRTRLKIENAKQVE